MKTLNNHTLIYDDNCPLCAAYTKGFIRSGMLDEQGRTVYEKGAACHASSLDVHRAKNEIALVNTQTGEVKYGISSLLKILGHRYPIIQKAGEARPIRFLLEKLYKFISFNRKVIAPSPTYLQQACVPDFNLSYRLAYLLFAAVITSTVLYRYSFLLAGFIPASNVGREYMVCFGQLAFQALLLLAFKANRRVLFDYLGNMMTVSLIGSLLLLPAFLIHSVLILPALFYPAYFMGVVACMFYLHTRRVKYIGAPWWLSLGWALYRCLVLLIIL